MSLTPGTRLDVEWYRSRLAQEFIYVDSDGSVLDKTAFPATA